MSFAALAVVLVLATLAVALIVSVRRAGRPSAAVSAPNGSGSTLRVASVPVAANIVLPAAELRAIDVPSLSATRSIDVPAPSTTRSGDEPAATADPPSSAPPPLEPAHTSFEPVIPAPAPAERSPVAAIAGEGDDRADSAATEPPPIDGTEPVAAADVAEIRWSSGFDSRSGPLDATARLRLIGDLGVIAQDWCVPLLAGAYLEEPHASHRQAALTALWACHSALAVPTLRLAVAGGDAAERAIAADALADLEPPPRVMRPRIVQRY